MKENYGTLIETIKSFKKEDYSLDFISEKRIVCHQTGGKFHLKIS